MTGGRNRMIGGLDKDGNPIEVQIDESLFGKSKYNRGHMRDGVWVFGGVEYINGKVGNWFAVLVPDRKRDTLLPLICKYIKPDSHIVSDGWAAYKHIKQMTTSGLEEVEDKEGMVLQDDKDYRQLCVEILVCYFIY